MQSNEQKAKEIATAIIRKMKNEVSTAVALAPFNTTLNGVVTEIIGKNYTVNIKKSVYTGIKALRSSFAINVGDKVIVIVPNGIMNNAFILGVLDE